MGAREAAARLRHDLGKAIRFSAPEVPETDTESLRARLAADVAATRRDRSGTRSAADVFDDWRAEEGRHFAGPLGRRVEELARTIAEVRALAARLDALSRPELDRLDSLTRAIAEGCRTLVREARGEAGR